MRGRRSELFFLPDLCALRSVLGLVVLTELFALILALASGGLGDRFWEELALMTLFMQWSSLLGSMCLCFGRGALARLGNIGGGIVSWGVLVGVVALLSTVAGLLEPYGVVHSGGSEFVLRNTLLAAVVSALVLRYFYVTHEWRRRTRAEGEARIQALQARIRPHFLFNSMNTIASLTRSDPVLAERVVEDLAELFRASLTTDRRLVGLAEELALTRRYLEIEQLRLGSRLAVEWQLEEGAGEALIPPLTLQPLVENAVYHGIEPRTDGGTVVITVRAAPEGLLLTVDNPLPEEGARARTGNRLALENIRDRIEACFPGEAALRVSTDGGRYRVELRLPRREEAI